MKHLNKKIRICAPVLLSLLFLTVACDDMNSIHQKYFERGITIHTGTVEDLRAYVGFETVRLAWSINADPRITQTVIFWNNRADSTVVAVNRTHSGFIPMYHDISGLREGHFLFEVITRDAHGHFSMPQEVGIYAIGELHVQSLRNRGVTAVRQRLDGSILVLWESIASPEIEYVTIHYEIGGVQHSVTVPNDDTRTILTGLSAGDRIGITTTYFHENAFEPLISRPTYFTVPELAIAQIPSATFSTFVLAGDNTTRNAGGGNDRLLSNIWTESSTRNPYIFHSGDGANNPMPNHFTIDMGMSASIAHFRMWQRTDNAPFTSNNLRTFELWGTNELLAEPTDGVYFAAGGPWRNDWIQLGSFEVIDPGGTAAERQAAWDAGQEFQIAPAQQQPVRYIRLIVNTVWGGSVTSAISIGRLDLFGILD